MNASQPARVFISYSHDSLQHKGKVLTLANNLRIRGIEAELDQYYDDVPPPEGWPRWMERQVRVSDFVIIVCTESYLKKSRGDSEPGAGLGVNWECLLTYQQLYNTGTVNTKFLPVVLHDSDIKFIPEPLQGTTWYLAHVRSGSEALCRRLLGHTKTQKPPLGRTNISVRDSLITTIEAEPESGPSLQVHESPFDGRFTPPTVSAVLDVEALGGTIAPTSQFYIERPADSVTIAELLKPAGTTLTIKGPRQVGKSSLLARLISQARRRDRRVAYLDFEGEFDTIDLESPDRFYKRFCSSLSAELGLEDMTSVSTHWREQLSNVRNCTNYLLNWIVPSVDGMLMLAIDQADRMFQTRFYSDFFGMIRHWHNKRAVDQRLASLDIVLVTSTEPQFFIADPHQSPFNVGVTVDLSDFNLDQLKHLNRLHGSILLESDVQELLNLTHGHPYLVRRAMYLVATSQITCRELIATATKSSGPFSEHLLRICQILSSYPEMQLGLVNVINGKPVPTAIRIRLLSAGLARPQDSSIVSRCTLYSKYFSELYHA